MADIDAAPAPIERLPDALRSSTLKHSLRLGRACFEVRDYVWDRPTQDVWTSDAYFVDLSLTPRPAPAWAEYVDDRSGARSRLGRVMFVAPGRMLRSGAAAGRQRSLDCTLPTGMIDDLLPHRPRWSRAALAEGLALNGTDIEWLLLRIYNELRRPGFGAETVVGSMSNALAVALIRRFGLDARDDRTRCAGGLAPYRLRRIRDRVHADQPPPDLSELAALCGMSIRHLTRAFKAETGQTIDTFVRQATIARARAMLLSSGRPVGEIARALGFANASSFAYAFRRATGLRPSDVSDRRPGGGERINPATMPRPPL